MQKLFAAVSCVRNEMSLFQRLPLARSLWIVHSSQNCIFRRYIDNQCLATEKSCAQGDQFSFHDGNVLPSLTGPVLLLSASGWEFGVERKSACPQVLF